MTAEALDLIGQLRATVDLLEAALRPVRPARGPQKLLDCESCGKAVTVTLDAADEYDCPACGAVGTWRMPSWPA